jgi:hypothetical protein
MAGDEKGEAQESNGQENRVLLRLLSLRRFTVSAT